MNRNGVLAPPSAMTIRSCAWPLACLLLATALTASCKPTSKPESEREPEDPDRATRASEDEQESEDTAGSSATENACRTRNVDLLFVIDNSGSMSEEQAKLARTVPELLSILASGNHDGKRSMAGEPTDFAPAESIHVGVISTDLGVNLAPAPNSCGDRSFVLNSDPSTNLVRVDKPFGDDGAMLNATQVAVEGISVPLLGSANLFPVVAPDPSCAEVQLEKPYLSYEPSDLFEDTGTAFSCISKLGRTGCGLEQQLEAMLKALTPAQSRRFTFSRDTRGQGTAPGANAGFLRADAVLAVVHITDEEDCSIPDESSGLFDPDSVQYPGGINTRCGLPANQSALHPIARYVAGLNALKQPRYRDRIIFAGIVGVPGAADSGSAVHNGEAALSRLLARPDMQFTTRSNSPGTDDEPVPTCISETSELGDGSAAPGRRFVQLAAEFGDNGLVSSICDDGYQGLIDRLSKLVAKHLGDCE
jgi:hypothetical protein